MSNQKKTRAKLESVAFVGVVGAILIVANLIAGNFSLGRFDLTRNDTFSLSEGSEQLVASLEDRMVITAYFSDNLPPPYNSTERYVRDILAEYEAASKGNVHVRVLSPNTAAEREQAESEGVPAVGQRVYANDSVSVIEGFRGLSITYKGETKAIPVIADNSGLEYQITMLMRQMTGERAKVGVITGHEGPALGSELAVLARVTPTYELVDVNLAEPIPEGVEALLLIGPQTPLSDAELTRLDAYVAGGGSLGVFGGTTKIDDTGPALSAAPVDSGIDRLLSKWGATLREDIVGDARCQVIGVQTPLGVAPRPYPPLTIVEFTPDATEHPATYHLTEARLPFTSSIELGAVPSGVTRTVLAESSEVSWSMSGPAINLDQSQRWAPTGDIGPFPLVVALEGKMPSAFGAETKEPARVLVVGSATVPIIQLPQGQEVSNEELAAALAFPLNAIDWLANEEGLVAIRAKTVDEPSLDIPQSVLEAQEEEAAAIENQDVEGVIAARENAKSGLEAWEAKKDSYRYLNMLGIPAVFALFGFLRLRSRSRKKNA